MFVSFITPPSIIPTWFNTKAFFFWESLFY